MANGYRLQQWTVVSWYANPNTELWVREATQRYVTQMKRKKDRTRWKKAPFHTCTHIEIKNVRRICPSNNKNNKIIDEGVYGAEVPQAHTRLIAFSGELHLREGDDQLGRREGVQRCISRRFGTRRIGVRVRLVRAAAAATTTHAVEVGLLTNELLQQLHGHLRTLVGGSSVFSAACRTNPIRMRLLLVLLVLRLVLRLAPRLLCARTRDKRIGASLQEV